MFSRLLAHLSPKQKSRLRSVDRLARQIFVRKFLSYRKPQLIKTMRALGIARGEALMVHSSFDVAGGFTGSPSEFIDALIEVVGPEGHLLMVSMPYLSSTYAYLQQGKIFDVRKTVSQMGIISETFRRRSGVLRSQHPSHPILAFGPRAAWLTKDHENCLYPCGLGTPFDKLFQLRGKVLFFNVSFYTFTFFHYLEERIKSRLDFPLFFPEPFEVPFIDLTGTRRIMRTYVYSLEANRRRRPEILKEEFDRQNLVKERRLGNSHLQLIATEDAVRCLDDMTARGIYFYSKDGASPSNPLP
ncbi:MAG TPA: AAC(3) family N-acetyltransferase [Candidatus Binatia bacterium]|jgi:aminoglycoside N3'-acetyltransferase